MSATLAVVMARYPRWKARGRYPTALFSKKGVNGSRTVYRERRNKTPCPDCGATDLIYRWVKSPYGVDKDRWFCFCGRTEVDDA